MSANPRKRRSQRQRRLDQRFTLRGVRRDPTDLGKLSRALLGLAMAEAERQAEADHTAHASDSDTAEATPEGGADA